MNLLAVLALVLQYGPAGIAAIEALVAELRPLFADGATPTKEEIEAAFARLDLSHADFQATE